MKTQYTEFYNISNNMLILNKLLKDYKADNKFENGIVKEIPEHTTTSIRIVYNCGGDWKNYKDYTSALTSVDDLYYGWKHKEI